MLIREDDTGYGIKQLAVPISICLNFHHAISIINSSSTEEFIKHAYSPSSDFSAFSLVISGKETKQSKKLLG